MILTRASIMDFLLEFDDQPPDLLFMAAVHDYEQSQTNAAENAHLQPRQGPSETHSNDNDTSLRPLLSKPGPSHRYAPPKSDNDVQLARIAGIPKTTQQDTKYCIRLWEDWRAHRQLTTSVRIGPILQLTTSELEHWMTKFILEARKRDGSEYTPNTLHHITAGIMRHIRWNGQPSIDFFKGSEFSEFRASLDSEMKRLQGLGIGTTKKQAEIISEAEEEILWEKGLLGDGTPKSLLNTIIFYNGLYFALRSGKEHRQLRFSSYQIKVIEQPGKRPFLRYTEDTSKNHPGGIKGRKITPKVVDHHANTENTERCFVTLFKKYCELCPKITPPSNAFYLQPLKSPTSTTWYGSQPLGHCTLGSTVARLCKLGGIQGYKTNHSLRATVTSRMYHADVEEQIFMERTGYRSLEGVRSYKRTSDNQRQALSDLLNRPDASIASDSTSNIKQARTPPSANTAVFTPSQFPFGLPSASFHNCSVNFYSGEVSTTTTREKKRRRVIIDSDDSD